MKNKKLPAIAVGLGLAAGGGVNQARIEGMSCGCGDVCVHNHKADISCELPGCAREHGVHMQAQEFLVRQDARNMMHAAKRGMERLAPSHINHAQAAKESRAAGAASKER